MGPGRSGAGQSEQKHHVVVVIRSEKKITSWVIYTVGRKMTDQTVDPHCSVNWQKDRRLSRAVIKTFKKERNFIQSCTGSDTNTN